MKVPPNKGIPRIKLHFNTHVLLVKGSVFVCIPVTLRIFLVTPTEDWQRVKNKIHR